MVQHTRALHYYIIEGFPKVRVMGQHITEWVEGVSYRSIDSRDEWYVRPIADFREHFSLVKL